MQRKTFARVLETVGALAGAGMLLAGILLLVAAFDSTHPLSQIVGAVTMGGTGAILFLARNLRPVRLVLGAVTMLLYVVSMLASFIVPNLQKLA